MASPSFCQVFCFYFAWVSPYWHSRARHTPGWWREWTHCCHPRNGAQPPSRCSTNLLQNMKNKIIRRPITLQDRYTRIEIQIQILLANSFTQHPKTNWDHKKKKIIKKKKIGTLWLPGNWACRCSAPMSAGTESKPQLPTMWTAFSDADSDSVACTSSKYWGSPLMSRKSAPPAMQALATGRPNFRYCQMKTCFTRSTKHVLRRYLVKYDNQNHTVI